MRANTQLEDWTPTRPADLQEPIEDPILAAEVVLLVCQRNLQIRMEKLRRAQRLMAQTIEIAQQAREEADHAVELVQAALWDLAEARS